MANKTMKTLTIGGNTYEIVDEYARSGVNSSVKTVNGIAPDKNGNVEIAEIPTDEHINSLINNALGVIENGTY
jgi:hypothetical protein